MVIAASNCSELRGAALSDVIVCIFSSSPLQRGVNRQCAWEQRRLIGGDADLTVQQDTNSDRHQFQDGKGAGYGDELPAIKRYLAMREYKLPWLFVSERGQPLTRRALNYLMRVIAADAGLPNVHPHTLWQTGALTCARCKTISATRIRAIACVNARVGTAFRRPPEIRVQGPPPRAPRVKSTADSRPCRPLLHEPRRPAASFS